MRELLAVQGEDNCGYYPRKYNAETWGENGITQTTDEGEYNSRANIILYGRPTCSHILAAVHYALVESAASDLPRPTGLVVYRVGRDRTRSTGEIVALALLERAAEQNEQRQRGSPKEEIQRRRRVLFHAVLPMNGEGYAVRWRASAPEHLLPPRRRHGASRGGDSELQVVYVPTVAIGKCDPRRHKLLPEEGERSARVRTSTARSEALHSCWVSLLRTSCTTRLQADPRAGPQ